MTDTVISSATREVVIGFDRPFVMIGERINPTGRKILAAEMAAGDFSRVEADARAQVEAGAHMLDVNAGIPLADEPAILASAIQLVQSITDVPLSIDSSIVAALEAGLAVYKGKALVNSVTGEEERLESVLPLVKKYGAAVVAISNDETGISEDPDVRFEVAKKIVRARRGSRHPGERRRGRPAGHADRRHQPGRGAGDAAAASAANRAEGEHHLRRLQRELRAAGARRHQRGVPDHGDRRRHDLRDHEPDAPRDRQGRHGRRRHDGPRSGLRALDPALPRSAARRGTAARPPARVRADGARAATAAGRPESGAPGASAWRLAIPSSSSRLRASAGAFPVGTPLLQAARSLGVDVDSVCGGRGLCGRCQVLVVEGEFAKHGVSSSSASLSPFSEPENPLFEAPAARRRPPPLLLSRACSAIW